MRVSLCDRCGAVINPRTSGVPVFIKDKPEIELCVSCALELNEWLKGEKKGDKEE